MNLRHFLIFCAASFVCLYLAYSSVVTIPYVRHDSLRYFQKLYQENTALKEHPFSEWLKAVGRPLNAMIENVIYQKVNHLSDLSNLKLLTLTVAALCAAILGGILVSIGIDSIIAFCLSVAVFTLPGIQEIIFVPFLPLMVAILLSLCAYAITLSQWPWVIRVSLGVLCLWASLLTYASSALFFLVPTGFFIVLKEGDWLSKRKMLVQGTLLWGLTSLCYLLMMKILLYSHLELTGHAIDLSLMGLLTRTGTFFSNCVPQTFNLWNIYYYKTLGITLGAFVGICLLLEVVGQKKVGGWQRFFAILVLFMAAHAVWFLFGGYLARTFIVPQAFAIVLLYWAFKKFWVMLPGQRDGIILAVIVLVGGLVCANSTTLWNVWNSNAEFLFIRSRLTRADYLTDRVHLIRAMNTGRSYNGRPGVYDNFNAESTWQYEVNDLIRIAIKDINVPSRQIRCKVTSSDYGEPVAGLTPRSIVINMNDLVRISRDHLK